MFLPNFAEASGVLAARCAEILLQRGQWTPGTRPWPACTLLTANRNEHVSSLSQVRSVLVGSMYSHSRSLRGRRAQISAAVRITRNVCTEYFALSRMVIALARFVR